MPVLPSRFGGTTEDGKANNLMKMTRLEKWLVNRNKKTEHNIARVQQRLAELPSEAIEDVLEQIVGDIADEHDIEAEDVMIMPRRSGETIVKALAPIDEFNAHFKTSFSDDEVDTVGGLVMTTLGRVPERSEKVDIGGLHFEILRADSRRIHLLKVTPVAKPARQATQ